MELLGPEFDFNKAKTESAETSRSGSYGSVQTIFSLLIIVAPLVVYFRYRRGVAAKKVGRSGRRSKV